MGGSESIPHRERMYFCRPSTGWLVTMRPRQDKTYNDKFSFRGKLLVDNVDLLAKVIDKCQNTNETTVPKFLADIVRHLGGAEHDRQCLGLMCAGVQRRRD